MIICLYWSAGAAMAMLNNQLWGKSLPIFWENLDDWDTTKPQKQSESSELNAIERDFTVFIPNIYERVSAF